MLDKFITPVIKPMLNTVVAVLHKRGITPDQLTMLGFLIGMLALPLIAFEFWCWGTCCHRGEPCF